MNSQQRRTRRRRMGFRAPHRCFWCGSLMPTWDGGCACPPDVIRRPRKLVLDCTVADLARGAWRRGMQLKVRLLPCGAMDLNVQEREEREDLEGRAAND